MKLAVIGGTGQIGSRVVAKLRDHGKEVRVGTRQRGVDTITGQGLSDLLDGVDVVVDVSNSPSYGYEDAQKYFALSTRNILAAEEVAGVRHHLALSILGADRVDGGYFRAKSAQEDLVRSSTVPHTVVRATLFFEFVEKLVEHAATTHQVRLPPVAVRPVAADDVATTLVRLAFAAPLQRVIEIAGPDEYFLNQLGRIFMDKVHDSRPVIADQDAYYLGAKLSIEDDPLVPDWRIGSTQFSDWLQTHGPHDGRPAPQISGRSRRPQHESNHRAQTN